MNEVTAYQTKIFTHLRELYGDGFQGPEDDLGFCVGKVDQIDIVYDSPQNEVHVEVSIEFYVIAGASLHVPQRFWASLERCPEILSLLGSIGWGNMEPDVFCQFLKQRGFVERTG